MDLYDIVEPDDQLHCGPRLAAAVSIIDVHDIEQIEDVVRALLNDCTAAAECRSIRSAWLSVLLRWHVRRVLDL